MKPYLSVLRVRFLLLLQYRLAALASMCAPMLFGLVIVMVFDTFYRSAAGVQPMSYAQTVTYVWLGQALLTVQPWNGDSEIMRMIRSGNLAYELCRPLSLYSYWFARALALRTAPMTLQSLPIFAFAAILPTNYRIRGPASLAALGSSLILLAGAIMISCAITNLMNIATLFSIAGEGIIRLVPALVMLLSGSIVPIPLFPLWIQRILHFLPFSGIVDTPQRFYVGLSSPSQMLPFLLHQFVWTAILVYAGQWLLARAMKRVVIQGG
ncbi:MAG: ABC transporter permease [Bacillota bacterium]